MEQIGTNWNILSQTHKYLMRIRLKIVFVSAKVLATVYVNEGFIAIEVADVPLDFVRVLRKSI